MSPSARSSEFVLFSKHALKYLPSINDVHITQKRRVFSFVSSVSVILFTTIPGFSLAAKCQFHCQNALPEPAWAEMQINSSYCKEGIIYICVCWRLHIFVRRCCEETIPGNDRGRHGPQHLQLAVLSKRQGWGQTEAGWNESHMWHP